MHPDSGNQCARSDAVGLSAPGASAACIDPGELADSAETVVVTLQGVSTALKVPNLDQAASLATTASSTMRSVADLVATIRPDAATGARKAADEVDAAKSQFPGGLATLDQAHTDWLQAIELAQTGQCPS